MIWWILLGLNILVGIFTFILKNTKFGEILFYYTISVGLIVSLSIVTVGIVLTVTYSQDINTFLKEKEYLEEVVPALSQTDNFSITTKKLEMNKWLYEVQYKYEHYKLFVFVPSSVMDLEEIK